MPMVPLPMQKRQPLRQAHEGFARPEATVPALTDKQILEEIARRTTTSVRGARVLELLPALPITERPLFARFAQLEAEGLIERVAGSRGEYAVTARGYATMAGGK